MQIIEVNAVGVHVENAETFVVTIGGSNSKTTQWRMDHQQFLLLIVEYAKERGILLPSFEPDGEVSEAKPWTPWVVPKK